MDTEPKNELTPLGAILAFFLIIFLVMSLVKIGLVWFT